MVLSNTQIYQAIWATNDSVFCDTIFMIALWSLLFLCCKSPGSKCNDLETWSPTNENSRILDLQEHQCTTRQKTGLSPACLNIPKTSQVDRPCSHRRSVRHCQLLVTWSPVRVKQAYEDRRGYNGFMMDYGFEVEWRLNAISDIKRPHFDRLPPSKPTHPPPFRECWGWAWDGLDHPRISAPNRHRHLQSFAVCSSWANLLRTYLKSCRPG